VEVLPEPSPTAHGLTVIADRYQILDKLAAGGMGAVYVASQLDLRRRVAIKTLHPEESADEGLRARFRREAEAVQRLTHPNTVRVYDFGETDDGWLYLVMEYLEGLMLDEVLHQLGPLPVDTVAHLGEQVLGSLIEAHAHGIVHRDIKPSNLMLCRQLGRRDFVKVLDFGLAHLERTSVDFKTLTGTTLGTPHYMSPEQVKGRPLDGRSDLYSLAMALFELATGAPPYDGATPFEVALKHVEPGPLSLPKELARTRLGRVIARAAQKRPDDRYDSATAMLCALTAAPTAERPELLERLGFVAAAPERHADPVPTLDRPLKPRRTSPPDRTLPLDVELERLVRSLHTQKSRWLGAAVLLGTIAVLALVLAGSSVSPARPSQSPSQGDLLQASAVPAPALSLNEAALAPVAVAVPSASPPVPAGTVSADAPWRPTRTVIRGGRALASALEAFTSRLPRSAGGRVEVPSGDATPRLDGASPPDPAAQNEQRRSGEASEDQAAAPTRERRRRPPAPEVDGYVLPLEF
jgi:serine/threonine protein kinase